MEETEYKDNEKVLDEYKVKLKDKPEEVDCIVTKSHLVIEAEEPIKLPFSHIVDCDVQYSLPSITYKSQPSKPPSGTATLTYRDELNKKNKLSLEMSAGSLHLFRQSINKQKDKYEPKEKYRYFIIAFFATIGPIIILCIFRVVLWDHSYDLSTTIAGIQLIYQVILVPIAFVISLIMRQWKVAKGVALGFALGLPLGVFAIGG